MPGAPSRHPDATSALTEAAQLAPRIAQQVGWGFTRAELEDLAQDLFVKTMKQMQTNPDKIKKLPVWMRGKARDLVKKYRRQRRRNLLHTAEHFASFEDASQPSPEDETVLRRLLHFIPDVFEKLSPRERRAAYGRSQSLSDEKLAESMSITVSAALTHISNARAKVRRHLSEVA